MRLQNAMFFMLNLLHLFLFYFFLKKSLKKINFDAILVIGGDAMILKVREKGQTQFPKEWRQEGFTGNLRAYMGSCTVVIEKPGATYDDIIKSLQLHIKQYKHKKEMKCE